MQYSIGKRFAFWVLFPTLALSAYSHSTFAMQFPIPPEPNAIIGEIRQVSARDGETLGLIGQREDIGYVEMAESNPGVDPDRVLGSGSTVTVPSSYILPQAPRHGIVINLAELRLYYYPAGQHVVLTFPVGIGREGWETPEGATRIGAKVKDPVWYPTDAVRADAASQGYYLPKSVPAGPDNPLGRYSLRIASTTYLIHSTNKPEGVGRRSSAGCMRMYPQDAEFLFKHVAVGTPVYIVNQPYKAGWQGNKLYLEAHMPLQEQQVNDGSDNAPLVQEVLRVAKQRDYKIDWAQVSKVAEEQSGLPTVVGYELRQTADNSPENNAEVQQFNMMNQINSAMNVVAPVKHNERTKHFVNNYYNDYAPKVTVQSEKKFAIPFFSSMMAQKGKTAPTASASVSRPSPTAQLPQAIVDQSKATSKAIVQSQQKSAVATQQQQQQHQSSVAVNVNPLGTLSARIEQGDIVIVQD